MLIIDEDNGWVRQEKDGQCQQWRLDSPEAFAAVSDAWLRAGWDSKYVYGFSWMGRPIIQLPEDLLRIQEVIWQLQPSVVVETGVAHGGSLVFYASILRALANKADIQRRVIGVDVEIRAHNRSAIEAHPLFDDITLIEGDAIAEDVVQQVASQIGADDRVLVILDSNHSKDHVLAELCLYGPLVTPGSYIVACDGIMQQLVGAPRSQPDWGDNNPRQAVAEFLRENDQFELCEPKFPFNEGQIQQRVSYWPEAFLRKKPSV